MWAAPAEALASPSIARKSQQIVIAIDLIRTDKMVRLVPKARGSSEFRVKPRRTASFSGINPHSARFLLGSPM